MVPRRTSWSSTVAQLAAIRSCTSTMRAAPAPRRWRTALRWCRRSTAARLRPARSRFLARCAALRSTFIVGPIPPEPPILPPILPPDPLPEPLPPGVFPIIGPEIATYGVVQPIARQLGMTTLGTLHERTGDTSLVANMGTPCPVDGDTRDRIWRKAPVKAPT